MARAERSLASQLFGVAVFIILLVVMLNTCSGDKDEYTKWDEKENTGMALMTARNAVKGYLNYPSSAKFETAFQIGVNGGIVISGSLQQQEYIVSSWVDSQNAFGTTIRTKFIVFVKQVSDGRWEVMEDSEGAPLIGLESEGN